MEEISYTPFYFYRVRRQFTMVSQSELLRYAIENDILDLQIIEARIEMRERNKYLEMHTHKIWVNQKGQWCTYLPAEDTPEHRKLYRRSTKEELYDIIVDYWKEEIENPTVREVFSEWNDRRLARRQIKPSTHLINTQIFNRFYGSFGKNRIKHLDETDWEDFLCDCIVDFNLTAKAFANLKGITKGFLKRAKKRKLTAMDVEHFFLELDVSDSDFKKRVVDDEKEVFYDDEIEKIMDYIRANPDPRNIGIALMFVTGIRVGELVALKHEDFHGTVFNIKRTETRKRDSETGRYIYYVDDFPKAPAGYRTVIVPTSQKWIVDKLKLCNPFGEFIFLDRQGERVNTVKIRKRLYLICGKVGIPPRSPHKIRKTYGTILLDYGMDQKLIESQMGHTTIACTEQYYHRDRRKLQEKQEAFDKIPQFM